MKLTTLFDAEVITVLKRGGVAVLRTDTLYGIVARAHDEAAVQRVYEIKGRTHTKSPIVLISGHEHMFDTYELAVHETVGQYWPGPHTFVLPSAAAPLWIRRGNASVAYRYPAHTELQELIHAVGPLIAPSANPEGLPPAMTIDEATGYFDDVVDIYVDGGTVENPNPSTIWRFTDGALEKLR